MAEALANKYRPHEFNEVCSQKSIVQILQRQLELKDIKNCYLFCGPSGTGKTTLARIFANKVNNNQGEPIEIDGASNNGVDNVKAIIQSAKERSVDSEYKTFIIDECHMITTQGWNAFLKCVEEPPKYTIFIFCTTDPQKIPSTILNRVMRFNLTKVKSEEIRYRLGYICENENCTNFDEAIGYISKICNGGVRDAIAMLDKCISYSNDLSIDNVMTSIGNFSYKEMLSLTNNIVDGEESKVISTIDSLYDNGNDMKLFIEQYLDFVLDLVKYCIFKEMSPLKVPSSLEEDIKYTTGIENNKNYFNAMVDILLHLKNEIRYDSNIKNTILVYFINMCRGIKC